MPIIIEGPDGAGKSTLAKSLAGALDMNILKMTANAIIMEVNDED